MKRVGDEDYEPSKYLFKTLKMGNFSDMNDLYNFQDVALLCELVDNRFQAMQDESVNLFKQTLTGGFSCVNTRLAFDTEILLPNASRGVVANELTKDQNYKICYDLKLYDHAEQQKYRVMTNILKLDGNNQFGFAMTKPMATGCIKDDHDLSSRTFSFLLEIVTLDDPIVHLYLVDIELDFDRLKPKQKVYNEICPPIIEKQKVIDIYERSTYQLLDTIN